jgi:hypothetical protein
MGLEEGIHHLCKIKLLKIYRCLGIMVVDYGLMLIFSVYWTFRRKSIESRIVGKQWKRNIKIFKDIQTLQCI